MEAPVRLCCGLRHWGCVCPDGRSMCCLCFKLCEENELNTREDGSLENVCIACAELEKSNKKSCHEQGSANQVSGETEIDLDMWGEA